MANEERDPRAYELMTVFIPELTDEDSQAEIEKIEALVTASGGTMTETLTSSPWGRRRLAYTIRFNGVDYRDGIYTVFHFDMRPSALAELEREMKLDTNLMRYLLVHDDPKAGERFDEREEDETDAADAGDEAATAEGGGTPPETTAEPAASGDAEPAAAEAAPADESPASGTVTQTAPAADAETPSGDETEKE